jgi:hypothetical protein
MPEAAVRSLLVRPVAPVQEPHAGPAVVSVLRRVQAARPEEDHAVPWARARHPTDVGFKMTRARPVNGFAGISPAPRANYVVELRTEVSPRTPLVHLVVGRDGTKMRAPSKKEFDRVRFSFKTGALVLLSELRSLGWSRLGRKS